MEVFVVATDAELQFFFLIFHFAFQHQAYRSPIVCEYIDINKKCLVSWKSPLEFLLSSYRPTRRKKNFTQHQHGTYTEAVAFTIEGVM